MQSEYKQSRSILITVMSPIHPHRKYIFFYPFSMKIGKFINMYLPNTSTRPGYDTRSIFKQIFNRIELRRFLFLNQLPYHCYSPHSSLIFSHRWRREDCWMHTFRKIINAMWNANTFVQDLNSGHWVHFLWW